MSDTESVDITYRGVRFVGEWEVGPHGPWHGAWAEGYPLCFVDGSQVDADRGFEIAANGQCLGCTMSHVGTLVESAIDDRATERQLSECRRQRGEVSRG